MAERAVKAWRGLTYVKAAVANQGHGRAENHHGADDLAFEHIAEPLKPRRLGQAEFIRLASMSDPARRAFGRGDMLSLDEQGDTACVLLDGVVSCAVETFDGARVETALLGAGEVIGWPSQEGLHHAWLTPGEAYLVSFKKLLASARREGLADRMRDELARICAERLQSTLVCRVQHSLQQRFCRRVLEMSRMTQTASIKMTQDEAAAALGVQRTSVTHVGVKLQSEGLIRIMRGRVMIKDYKGLERLSCGCEPKTPPQIGAGPARASRPAD